jgi:hypothetical protein
VDVSAAGVTAHLDGTPKVQIGPVDVDLPKMEIGPVKVDVTLPEIRFQATKRLGGILAALAGGGVGLEDALREILGTFSPHDFDDVARVQFGPMHVEVQPVNADLGRVEVHAGRDRSAQPVTAEAQLEGTTVTAKVDPLTLKVAGKPKATVGVTGGWGVL